MVESVEKDLYRSGESSALDKNYAAYKKINVWIGSGLNALTETEIDLMAKL